MKKVFAIIILMMLVAGMVTSCAGSAVSTIFEWSVVESPVTGRYYEIATQNIGYTVFVAMSEVTRTEYEAYIAGLQE